MIKNRNGFTLVELLATLVILGIVVGLVTVSVTGTFKSAKEKTEEVFIETLEDALEVYINSDAKNLTFSTSEDYCTINKTHGQIKVYKANGSRTFSAVVNSSFSPLDASDVKNPANEKKACKIDNSAYPLNIYRDEDFVYYYEIDKRAFECLTGTERITNLPSVCIK